MQNTLLTLTEMIEFNLPLNINRTYKTPILWNEKKNKMIVPYFSIKIVAKLIKSIIIIFYPFLFP